MYKKKHYKELNIQPLYKIDVKQKKELTYKLSKLLVDTFPKQQLNYSKIAKVLNNTEMYISKIPTGVSPVNYSYIDETIYISDEIEVDIKNEFLLHEFLHRIQESRNKKNKLIQIGICNIFETKIQGLAINEATTQYIVKKILGSENQIVEIYDMKIPTISKNYYPILTNLIEQITYLIGDDILIYSNLNGKDDFMYYAIDNLGEKTYFSIQSNFDKILDAKNNILKHKDVQANINIIKDTYKETQYIILTNYFDNMFRKIETPYELKQYQNKLLNYKKYMGVIDEQYIFTEYFNKKENDIKELQSKIESKALTVIKGNKIINILNKIINYFEKKVLNNL